MKEDHSELSSGPNHLSLHNRTQPRISLQWGSSYQLGGFDLIKQRHTFWIMFKTLMRRTLKLLNIKIRHLIERMFDFGFCIMKGINILAVSNFE
jgi:hypothetical protein